jgi:hypothetical protein
MRHEIIEDARALGVDVIDLKDDFRWAVADLGTAVGDGGKPCGGHYSEAGDVIYKRLAQYLQLRDESPGLADNWQQAGQGVYSGRPTRAGGRPFAVSTSCHLSAFAALADERSPICFCHIAR